MSRVRIVCWAMTAVLSLATATGLVAGAALRASRAPLRRVVEAAFVPFLAAIVLMDWREASGASPFRSWSFAVLLGSQNNLSPGGGGRGRNPNCPHQAGQREKMKILRRAARG